MKTQQLIQWFFQFEPTESPILIPKRGRLSLAKFYHHMGFHRGAEIGVRRGEHAEMMCQTVPGLQLLLVDPWAPQDGYLEKKPSDAEAMNQWFADAQARLRPYPCIFIRHPSVIGARLVPDRSLDFVYIDGNHRADFVLQDLEVWTPKVRSGGIIAGHDYANRPERHIEVKEAVDTFTAHHNIEPWYVLSGVKGDKMPSWFWVVE